MTEPRPSLNDWIGRTEARTDIAALSVIRGMAATLDIDPNRFREGDAVPPSWHWLFFNDCARISELGPDGHPARGGFLPPVPLPRRMWAGGRLGFPRDLPIGAEITRRSEILSVTEKAGRSGPLCFVTVRHVVSDAEGVSVEEEHDIVYRGAPKPRTPKPRTPKPETPAPQRRAAPADPAFERVWTASPTILFRYSALTFNGHRIHYDVDYCREDEGYPGLVVHGPLIATMMLGLAEESLPDRRIARFDFRAVAPVFHQDRFVVAGRIEPDGAVALWATGEDGALRVSGEAETTPR